jgi:ribonuclease P/MRP protein subunit POP1
VLLIQRSVEANTVSTTSSKTHSPAVHGWTLILPQGWAMPFFSSLIFTGTRVGGQRERQTQAFESGVSYFPRDYPCTTAYDELSENRAAEEQDTWARKPPAKRPNYKRLGTRSPWQPDWDVVLGLREPTVEAADTDVDASTVPGEFVPAQRGTDLDMEVAGGEEAAQDVPAGETTDATIEPWLLRGPQLHTVLATLVARTDSALECYKQFSRLRTKRGLGSLPAHIRAEDLWTHALVRVRLRLCGRGCPEDLAMIYAMNDDEARRWLSVEQLHKKLANGEAAVTEGETEVGIVSHGYDRSMPI